MEINRTEFLSVLLSLKPGLVLKGGAVLKQSSHFIFTKDCVATYNDQICITHPFSLGFECSVEGESLYSLLSGVTEDNISVFLKGSELVVKSTSVVAGLPVVFEGEVYKLVKEVEDNKPQKWKSLPPDFIEGASLCLFTVSKDMTLRHLSCISVSGRDVISSDIFRISHYKLQSGSFPQLLIPGTAVVELVKLPVVKYASTPSWVYFKTKENVFFASRLLQEEFPDCLHFFSVEKKDEVHLPSKLRDTIVVLGGFVEESIGEEMKEGIQIHIADGHIVCKVKSTKGWIEKKELIGYKGKAITFNIAPSFLYEILDKATTMVVDGGKALFTSGAFRYVTVLLVDK